MTLTRAIQGLQFAHRAERPGAFGVSRPRGAKAHGVRYEKALAKALPVAKHGQWFEFIDQNGHGFCQTDLLLEFDHAVVVLEAKYTWTPQGHFQVDRLYRPVVARAFGKPAFGLVVCRALLDDMPNTLVVGHLAEALAWCDRKPVALHWLGGQGGLGLGPRFGAPISAHIPIMVPARKRA